jgi:hypothetical protein
MSLLAILLPAAGRAHPASCQRPGRAHSPTCRDGRRRIPATHSLTCRHPSLLGSEAVVTDRSNSNSAHMASLHSRPDSMDTGLASRPGLRPATTEGSSRPPAGPGAQKRGHRPTGSRIRQESLCDSFVAGRCVMRAATSHTQNAFEPGLVPGLRHLA